MGTKYQLERMPLEALDRVCAKMKDDFASAERKPEVFLRRQMKSGISTGWLLLADGEEAGYAFVIADPSVPVALLDYVAVERRGQGDGSAFLALLQEEYPQGMIVEAEDEVPGDSDSENELRRRRMKFYERAGFQPCSFDNEIFGVRYAIYAWLPDADTEETEAIDEQDSDASRARDLKARATSALDDLYRIQVPKGLYQAFVHIRSLRSGRTDNPDNPDNPDRT